MRKKIWLFIIIVMALLLLSAISCYAAIPTPSPTDNRGVINSIVNNLNTNEFDQQIQKSSPDYSLKDFVINSLSGRDAFSYKDILNNILDRGKSIFIDNIYIFITLIVISIFSGFIKSLLINMEGTTAKACSYSILAIYVSLLLKIFYDCYSSCYAYVDVVSNILYKFFPIFGTVTVFSGKVISATLSTQVLFWTTAAFAYLIKNFFLPVIIGFVIFSIVNSLSKEYSFSGLTSFMSNSIKWALGGIMTIFVGIVSLQGVIAPVADNLMLNTSTYTVKTGVPILGSILSDTVNFMASSGGIIKSAVGVAGLVGLVLVCFIPILTILIKKIILSTSTAILEPVADPNLSNVVNNFASGLLLLILVEVSLAVMGFINISLLIRSF